MWSVVLFTAILNGSGRYWPRPSVLCFATTLEPGKDFFTIHTCFVRCESHS